MKLEAKAEREKLVKEFAESVAAQSEAIARADARTGNRYARRYIAAFDRLRAHGDDGREALATLLTAERADVRVMAAAYLLRYSESRARPILEAEANGTGLVAFGAAQALKRWEEGSWELDPVS